MPTKKLIVVGGPNGAGKTTFVEEYLRRNPIEYLGADLIAAELSPGNPAIAAIAAGREFLRRVNEKIAGNDSFIVETTLLGKSFRHALIDANKAGFVTIIHFVFTAGPDACVSRVAERVRRGGHRVPEVDVRRRFSRSLGNFWTLYRPLVDEWVLTYNADDASVHVAHGIADDMVAFDEPLLDRFFQLAEVEIDDSEKP